MSSYYPQSFYDRLPHLTEADKILDELSVWQETPSKDAYRAALKRVLAGSEFALRSFLRLQQNNEIPKVLLRKHYNASAVIRAFEESATLNPIEVVGDDLADFIAQQESELRSHRDKFMLLAIWVHTAKLVDLLQFTQVLSKFADNILQRFTSLHFKQLTQQHGSPRNSEGALQHFGILALGKLGGHELNLSSDIDCVFFFGEKGNTDGKKSVSNQEFFEKLGRKIISSVQSVKNNQIIFRMDLRLRPFGASGALASSLSALDHYYETHGRAWERFALIKARVCAHTSESLAHTDIIKLQNLIRPFVYRNYTDFSLLDSLRELKDKIRAEQRKIDGNVNVKLGEGGIRDIEFIVQALQLIHGGRCKQLQTPSLNACINELVNLDKLAPEQAASLFRSYVQLRDLEHSLQAVRDQQTQTLPSDPESLLQFLILEEDKLFELAESFNTSRSFDDLSASAVKRCAQAMQPVETFFREFLSLENEADTDIGEKAHNIQQVDEYASNWYQQWLAVLEEKNENSVGAFDKRFIELAREVKSYSPDESLLKKFNGLIRQLLSSCEQASFSEAQTVVVIDRLQDLLLILLRRGVYIDLLKENKHTRDQLVQLAMLSGSIAKKLAKYPQLLDELLQPESLYQLPQRAALLSELNQSLLRVDSYDLDERLQANMIAIRDFKQRESLRAAVCELSGALPLMQVSDYLSFLAEAILQRSLELVWLHMSERFGSPDNSTHPQRFAILAMGKLGGLELSHSSDLDLIFLHDWPINGYVERADGKRLENPVWLVRLAQKLIWFISTPLANGRLYEVDMRLRPSGNSGLLVSSIEGFEQYQRNSAWTWEHQALLRSRVVAGEPQNINSASAAEDFTQRVEHLRLDLLQFASSKYTPSELKKEVISMREKMRAHLGPKDGEPLSLKQSPGGMVDIEFLCQYWCLRYAQSFACVVNYSDNLRQLQTIGETHQQLKTDCEALAANYLALRTAAHRQALGSEQVPSEIETVMEQVRQIWRRHLG